ncbi:putative bifunctional diguanylate cyclase/phosphodiesterase [Pseudidiomarina insulisalsae]|uniref:putative bifunctional diguanylate cyclase/phosphodiesterase n=1 Tax=Pseudidiomarina insulisalsae TaxID=575789 RepID=UPI0018E517EF|nr:EAL domain-containing protein [Pseudidiomarina insulisalsae]
MNEQAVGWYNEASDQSHQRRFGLIANFTDALQANDELYLVYQPRLDMVSGEYIGAEALIRWNHPTLGAVSPMEFVPLIERTPLARELTDWVIRNAVRQAAQWREQGNELQISVNIAAANLEEENFCDRLLHYLKQAGLQRNAVELELTESSLMNNNKAASEQLHCIASSGLSLAIDDFGTGYSSLAYLQNIPARVVKIDRAFIDGIENNDRKQVLVRAMISMTQELGYRVVAEGIETEAAHRLLKNFGCDEVQGYLFGRPMKQKEFERWLEGA